MIFCMQKNAFLTDIMENYGEISVLRNFMIYFSFLYRNLFILKLTQIGNRSQKITSSESMLDGKSHFFCFA